MEEADAGGADEAPDEATLVLEELRRARDRPVPRDPSSAGCAVAVVALLAVVLMPFAGRALDMSGNAMGATALVLLAVAVAGALSGIVLGDRATRSVTVEAEVAAAELVAAHATGDRNALRSAAVRLLDSAFITAGPSTVRTFDPEAMADRLGPALPYVREVERILVDSGEAYSVFTALP